jgi:nicotinate-nucleotide adenylyltransferase
MRLGIFGGSFDPVHNGHLALTHACQRQGGLDEVWFMPTAVQPLKQQGPRASDKDRLAMLQLAVQTEPNWRVSKLEIDRGGLSYTIDTLRQLDEELPEAVLFFLLGADAVADVPNWREPAAIFALATPLVVRRSGSPAPDLTALRALCAENKRPKLIEMPAVDASSTEIRRRAAAGESIAEFVPAPVAADIAAHSLYR